MQSKEYLEQKRTELKKDLEDTLKTAREHIASEETALRDKQVALQDFVKQSQRRVSQLEGAIMGMNEALADPAAEQPESAKKPDAPTSTPSNAA